jgi:hypothetical protein
MTIPRKPPALIYQVEEVRAELRTSCYSEVRRVECDETDGYLVLTGTVSTFYLKQMAQTLLFQRFGFSLPLVNDLRVLPDDADPLPRKPR